MGIRLSIRDLLWLVVLVALTVGWIVDHCILTRQRDKASSDAVLFWGDATGYKALYKQLRNALNEPAQKDPQLRAVLKQFDPP